jgi:hypothetical protein
MTIVVTNVGADPVGIVRPLDDNGSPFSVFLGQPEGWLLRSPEFLHMYCSHGPAAELIRPQESLVRTVYLHDKFSQLLPGRTALRVTVSVTIGSQEQPQQLRLEAVAHLDLVKQGLDQLARRIATLRSQIQGAGSCLERCPLYRSVMGLSHPDLIPLFFDMLSDDSICAERLEHVVRVRLVELCETYTHRQLLVEYLSTRGEMGDQPIFELWKQAGVRPSDLQIMQLHCARNPWVQLHTLEYFGGNRANYESLQNQIDDLDRHFREVMSTVDGARVARPVDSGRDVAIAERAAPRVQEPLDKARRFPVLPLLGVGLFGLVLGLVGGFLLRTGRVRRGRLRSGRGSDDADGNG